MVPDTLETGVGASEGDALVLVVGSEDLVLECVSEGDVLGFGWEEPGYRIPERGNVDETTGWRNTGFGTLELVPSSV